MSPGAVAHVQRQQGRSEPAPPGMKRSPSRSKGAHGRGRPLHQQQLPKQSETLLSCLSRSALFFFFLNQKFITQGSLAVRGRDIQTIRKLRLRYALAVMYYQNLDAVSGRQTWASPRVSIDDVTLSSRVCSRALTTGPTPNRDVPPDCPHHVPQPEPNTRLGQSLDGVNSP
jgi:hypothetical protein